MVDSPMDMYTIARRWDKISDSEIARFKAELVRQLELDYTPMVKPVCECICSSGVDEFYDVYIRDGRTLRDHARVEIASSGGADGNTFKFCYGEYYIDGLVVPGEPGVWCPFTDTYYPPDTEDDPDTKDDPDR